jgi:Lrp/AsnC family leucine-responsive transcriptional regulator
MSSIDSHDRQLLALVQSNSRLSYAELGERVGLSASAVHDRLKKLQTQGVIHGFGARLDPRALGLELCAFIQVLIERPEHDGPFVAAMEALPEVLECHHITGDYGYLLKVRTHDARSLERLIAGSIKSLPGVVRTLTMVALSTAKETAAVAVDASAQA